MENDFTINDLQENQIGKLQFNLNFQQTKKVTINLRKIQITLNNLFDNSLNIVAVINVILNRGLVINQKILN